jgi:hypothetical protein
MGHPMKAGAFSHREHQARVRPPAPVASRRLSSVLVIVGALILALFVVWIASRVAGIRGQAESDTPPTALQGAVPARPPVLAPQIEPLPSRSPRGRTGDPGAVDRALATQSTSELQLLSDLNRLDVPPPPILDELFERRRAGATPDELRRFVRARFPRSLKLRMATLRWIKRIDSAGASEPAPARAGRAAPPLGSIEPARPRR